MYKLICSEIVDDVGKWGERNSERREGRRNRDGDETEGRTAQTPKVSMTRAKRKGRKLAMSHLCFGGHKNQCGHKVDILAAGRRGAILGQPNRKRRRRSRDRKQAKWKCGPMSGGTGRHSRPSQGNGRGMDGREGRGGREEFRKATKTRRGRRGRGHRLGHKAGGREAVLRPKREMEEGRRRGGQRPEPRAKPGDGHVAKRERAGGNRTHGRGTGDPPPIQPALCLTLCHFDSSSQRPVSALMPQAPFSRLFLCPFPEPSISGTPRLPSDHGRGRACGQMGQTGPRGPKIPFPYPTSLSGQPLSLPHRIILFIALLFPSSCASPRHFDSSLCPVLLPPFSAFPVPFGLFLATFPLPSPPVFGASSSFPPII